MSLLQVTRQLRLAWITTQKKTSTKDFFSIPSPSGKKKVKQRKLKKVRLSLLKLLLRVPLKPLEKPGPLRHRFEYGPVQSFGSYKTVEINMGLLPMLKLMRLGEYRHRR